MKHILARLDARRERARVGGGKERISAQHAKGKLTAPTSAPDPSSCPSSFASGTTLARADRRNGQASSKPSSPERVRRRLDTDYTYNAGTVLPPDSPLPPAAGQIRTLPIAGGEIRLRARGVVSR